MTRRIKRGRFEFIPISSQLKRLKKKKKKKKEGETQFFFPFWHEIEMQVIEKNRVEWNFFPDTRAMYRETDLARDRCNDHWNNFHPASPSVIHRSRTSVALAVGKAAPRLSGIVCHTQFRNRTQMKTHESLISRILLIAIERSTYTHHHFHARARLVRWS